MEDNIKVTGKIYITLYDEFGCLKEELYKDNLVVSASKSILAQSLTGAISTSYGYMAIGTGTTSPTTSDTTLQTQVSRVATSSATTTAQTASFSASYPAGTPAGTNAITEAGIFSAATLGTMLSRVTFAAINKGPTDTLAITWTVTIN